MSPALAGGFLTTAPPGKPRRRLLMKRKQGTLGSEQGHQEGKRGQPPHLPVPESPVVLVSCPFYRGGNRGSEKQSHQWVSQLGCWGWSSQRTELDAALCLHTCSLWFRMHRWMLCFCTLSYRSPELGHCKPSFGNLRGSQGRRVVHLGSSQPHT